MKVLYYHQHFSTPAGATGTRSYEMARALVERGHEVCLVTGSTARGKTGLTGPYKRGKRTGVVDGIEVIEFNLPYSNTDPFLKRAWLFVRFAMRSSLVALTRRYDVLFATSTPLTAAIPGIVGRISRRKPFVFEVRDLWPELPKAMGVIRNPIVLGAMSVLEWLGYKTATRCIGLSPGICQGIIKRGTDPAKVAMVPNGCDNERFAAVQPGRPESPQNLDFLAVFAGAHGIANGLGAVLDAASVLRQRGRTDIHLVFVGSGMKRQELVERAETEGLTNCLFFDPMPKEDLIALLKAAGAGLMILDNVPAFYYGTSPNKFFDYISCGLPVLNNYPGWLANLISENECGIAVEPEDPELLASALERLADRKSEREAMRKRSHELSRKFDRRRLAAEFIDVLESARGRPGRQQTIASAEGPES